MRQEITSVGKDVQKRAPSFTAGGNAKWYRHLEDNWQFLTNKYAVTTQSSHNTPWYLPEGVENVYSYKNLHADIIAALSIIAKTWKPPRCPSVCE